MAIGIAEIVGQEISEVIVATDTRPPHQQLFLTFSDGTCFEIWGSSFTCAGGVGRGGPEAAAGYILKNGGKVTATYGDA